jgi:epoxide hydrolase 4
MVAWAAKSAHFFFFDLPELPETVVHANHWHFFRHFLSDARPAFTKEETDRYIEAWSQKGAATGMINYYRSSVRTSPKRAEAALRPVEAPTLVIWGERDRYLGPELTMPQVYRTLRVAPTGHRWPARTRPR